MVVICFFGQTIAATNRRTNWAWQRVAMPLSTPQPLKSLGLEFRPWVHKTADAVENANMPEMPNIQMPEINMPSLPNRPKIVTVDAPAAPSPAKQEESFLQSLLSGNLLNGCCAHESSIDVVYNSEADPADDVTLAELEIARKKLELVKASLENDAQKSEDEEEEEISPVTPPPPAEQTHRWDMTPPMTQHKKGGTEDLCTPPGSNRASRASSRAQAMPPLLPPLLEVQEHVGENKKLSTPIMLTVDR
jgi:hypothetical protein